MKSKLKLLFFVIFPSIISAKSIIEPCNSSDTCPALLSYVLPWDSKLSETASRFQVNVSDLVSSNSLDPTKPSIETQIIPKNSLVKVPITCPCVDGIRRYVSANYTVRAADTIDSISVGFGGLVSANQIRSFNGVYGWDRLVIGQILVIPLPCTCFNNINNGVTAVYMSIVVRKGESLCSIAREYGTTVTDLEAVNGLAQQVVDPGDIISVPIPACSSANLNWRNESLIVPNSSYVLTANNCIKCSCGPTDLNLRCISFGLATSRSHLQCKGTNLLIGDIYEVQTQKGCNVSSCVYRGHLGGKIFRSLVNSSQIQCTGNQSHSTISPTPLYHSVIPLTTISPSPAPTTMSNSSGAIVASHPASIQYSNISSNGGPCLGFLLFDLVLSIILSHLLEHYVCIH